MKKICKWAFAVLATSLVLIAAFVLAINLMSDRKRARVIQFDIKPVAYVNDAANIAHGKYLYELRGCMECQGEQGTGRVVIDDPNGLLVRAPNITADPGGVVTQYTERDWVATLRHGVNPDGPALLIMPSEDYSRWTDADLAALVSYVRQLPAASGQTGFVRMPLIVKALYVFGGIKDAAEKIDHRLPMPEPVPVAASAEHGAYVANMCTGCHGPALSGGPIPASPPDWPPAANLTSAGGVIQRYATFENFREMMRSGKRPDGRAISQVMPFASLKKINDIDLAAVYAFLKTR